MGFFAVRGADAHTLRRVRSLRRAMTDAEIKLWNALRSRRLAGHKFVRQESIGPFIADFCCRERKLIVEADGSQHADSVRDARRDAYLRVLGYRIVRFWNHEILESPEMVEDTIRAALDCGWTPDR
jgi:very-short-patch-repair endonuclease